MLRLMIVFIFATLISGCVAIYKEPDAGARIANVNFFGISNTKGESSNYYIAPIQNGCYKNSEMALVSESPSTMKVIAGEPIAIRYRYTTKYGGYSGGATCEVEIRVVLEEGASYTVEYTHNGKTITQHLLDGTLSSVRNVKTCGVAVRGKNDVYIEARKALRC